MKKIPKKEGTARLVVFLVVVFLACFLAGARNVKAVDEVNIQEDINALQKKIDKEQAEKEKLEQELGTIQYQVNSTQKEILKTESTIKTIEADIARKEKEIILLQEKTELQKKVLENLIKEMFYIRKSSLFSVIFGEGDFSDILGRVDHLVSIEQKTLSLAKEIQATKEKTGQEKEKLKSNQDEHAKMLALKEDQAQDLLAEKKETQLDISQKEATIGELQGKLTQLRSNLSGYLGKAYNAKDIEDAASFASKATGVRKDFIMGMLVVESDLGRFTGGCYAKDSRMSGRRLEIFKSICSELDYDWKKRKVSCPPKGYTGTGGAMGVAQFMSDTWIGYQGSIARTTGNNPPDPWNLTDGVAAMALKLAKVPGVTSQKKSGECNAAKLYLSGTTSAKYDWYCQKVLYWADNYERLLGK